MSAPIPADDFKLAIARSDFLDSFNEADLMVRARLIALKGKPQQLLGPNIEALLKIPAGPQYPKAEKARVDAAASQLRDLKQFRCDLVHGVMDRIVVSGIAHALFQNVQETSPFGRMGLLINEAELNLASKTLRQLTKVLSPKHANVPGGNSPDQT